KVPSGGFMGANTNAAKMKTLFTDLSAQDIGDVASAETDIYLVVKVRTTQPIAAPPDMTSRSGAGGHVPSARDHSKPPVSMNKGGSRRSIMFSKGSRSGWSRGGTTKLDSVTEQSGRRPSTNGTRDSLDGSLPPS